jgi:hypothetical protein
MVMRFAICTAVESAGQARSAGWELVEENVQTRLQGHLPDGPTTDTT